MITRGAQEFSPARKQESDPCCRQLPPRITIARRDSAPRGFERGGGEKEGKKPIADERHTRMKRCRAQSMNN